MTKNLLTNSRRAASGSIAVFLMVIAPVSGVLGQEWRIEPRLTVGGEVDDNAALDPDTSLEADISGLLLEGSARFFYLSETTEFFATPRLLTREYGEPEFDSNDQFLRTGYEHKSQFSNFRIDASYRRELVRTAERLDTEFDIEDPDEIPVDASSRVAIRDRRESIELHPTFSYRLSQVSTVGAGLRFEDVTYDESLAGLLTDYTILRGNLNYKRGWTPRNSWIVEATFRQFESGNRDAANGYGLQTGFESRLSETTRIRALVGVDDAELDTGGNDTNVVGNITLVRSLQTITMIAQYRRVISGGGGGTLAARDMLNLNFRRKLSDRISAGIGMRAYTTTALEDGTVTADERDYLQLRAQFIWRLSQTVDVEFNYRYTILNRELIGESANSNNVTLLFNWRPRDITGK